MHSLKIPSFLAKRQNASSVCTVTGITYEVPDIPALSSFFVFVHPLAVPEHALDFANLPISERKKCPNQALAGAILSIMRHYHLDGDTLSALERNILLSSVPQKTLLNALSFFACISARQSRRLDSFSFDSFKGYEQDKEKYCGIAPSFASYIAGCELILNPQNKTQATEEHETPVYKLNVSKTGTTKVPALTKELKNAFRTNIIALRIQGSISDKLAAKLNSFTIGNVLYMLEDEIRAKYISKLQACMTEENTLQVSYLIKVLRNTDKNQISGNIQEDKNTNNDLEVAFSEVSYGTKKNSLAERFSALAKKRKVQEEVKELFEEEQASIEEEKEESNEEDFSNENLDSIEFEAFQNLDEEI